VVINKCDSWAVLFQKGKSLTALGRHEEALEAYEKAIEINPNAWGVWYQKAKSLNALGRHEEALEALEKVEKIKQAHPGALNKEGITLKKLGREKGSAGDKEDTMAAKKMDVCVFISYIHENKKVVNRLCEYLRNSGIKVWLDVKDIKPGQFWKNTIRDAIQNGSCFIACFSKEYNEREKTYMNEELYLAIDELRTRPTDQIWFIPVILSGEIPNFSINSRKTLRDLQWVDLRQNWADGIRQILSTIAPDAR